MLPCVSFSLKYIYIYSQEQNETNRYQSCKSLLKSSFKANKSYHSEIMCQLEMTQETIIQSTKRNKTRLTSI
jgi:hypothetical protein